MRGESQVGNMSSKVLTCAPECVVVPLNDREKFVRRRMGRRRGEVIPLWTPELAATEYSPGDLELCCPVQ